MPKRTRSYAAWQLEKLSNPKLAVGYLNSALSDSPEMFLIALRKVAQASEMARVAKEAGITREALYHALSQEGNPTFSTLRGVLSVLGMGLEIISKNAKGGIENASVPESSENVPPFNLIQNSGNSILVGSSWFRSSSTAHERIPMLEIPEIIQGFQRTEKNQLPLGVLGSSNIPGAVYGTGD